MGCGCGNKHRKYEVTKADGSKEVVDSLTAAMRLVRAHGGTYQTIMVNGPRR